jgi:uncharacterized membrane protein
MYTIILVILYFDGRGFALFISLIYMVLSILFTILFDNFAAGLVGFGFMIASIISMLTAVILLIIFTKNLKRYIFIMKNNG